MTDFVPKKETKQQSSPSDVESNANESSSGRSGLMKSTLVFSGMTQISRVLGMIRDMLFAYLFPLGGATDAFFVAFKIPNFFRRLFAEGAFSQAFVPIFSEYKETKTPHELQILVSHVFGTLSLVLFLLTGLGIIFAPEVISVYALGFRDDPATFELASYFLQITFPYLFFISLTAFAAGILNSYGRFAAPAIAPAILNICLIVSAYYFSGYFLEPVTALAWGVLVAGILQFILQLPFLWKLKMLVWPRWGGKDEGVCRIVTLMMPAIFGSAIVQLNLLIDVMIASMLSQKSVSWLYYSDRLVEFPLGIFGVAIATVILPTLSQKHTQNNPEDFSDTLNWALKLIVVVGLPAATGLVCLASPMLATLFQYGSFTSNDTQMATYSLIAYATGLPAFLLIKSLLTGFFAKQNTSTPVKVGIIAMVINIVLNIVIVYPMVKLHFIAPHMGLAIATSLSAWAQVIILFLLLKNSKVYRPEKGWLSIWLKSIAACMVMGLGLVMLSNFDWLSLIHWQRILSLFVIILCGVLLYVVCLLLMGVRPKHLLEK